MAYNIGKVVEKQGVKSVVTDVYLHRPPESDFGAFDRGQIRNLKNSIEGHEHKVRRAYKQLNEKYAIVCPVWTRDLAADFNAEAMPVTANIPKGLIDLWYQNFGWNRPKMKKSINDLKGKHEGKIAVIIGTGASLHDSYPPLQRYHDGVVVAKRALDASRVRPTASLYCEEGEDEECGLVKDDRKVVFIGVNAGLQPALNLLDYWVCTDAQADTRWVPNVRLPDKLELLCSVFTNLRIPRLINSPNGVRFFTDSGGGGINDEIRKTLPDYDGLDHSLATTTYTALHLAVYLGCKAIVFVGQDFCFRAGRANFFAPATYCDEHMYEVVQTIFKTCAVTRNDLQFGARQISRACEFLFERGYSIINATGCGILNSPQIMIQQEIKNVIRVF